MDGINTTAQTVGQIAEQLNAQSYKALSQYQQTLPTITSIDNAAYGFTSQLYQQQAQSSTAFASRLYQGINSLSQQNAQMVSNDTAQGIGQYNVIAQTGKQKK